MAQFICFSFVYSFQLSVFFSRIYRLISFSRKLIVWTLLTQCLHFLYHFSCFLILPYQFDQFNYNSVDFSLCKYFRSHRYNLCTFLFCRWVFILFLSFFLLVFEKNSWILENTTTKSHKHLRYNYTSSGHIKLYGYVELKIWRG